MSTANPHRRFSWLERTLLVAASLVLTVLLVAAAMLSPDSRGFGTHQKLGFGECFVVAQWGVRCPSCGMTTSWARLLDGQLTAALGANAGGVLLCLASIAAVPWMLASAIKGQWWYLRPTASLVLPAFAVLVLVLLVQWMQHTGLALLRHGWS
ncbi:DUF2752 domain-containing protein [Aeoliella mucimassa]|uniref:DUF2752 domain-containing protein n=1 Tax=Aeoliella mucimassa TaxID=2527972 RepID=UPI0018D2A8E0|nr:DUF2752 domain-containing protein [Aeoliella mucimassa]